jgi:hypothetical protein
MNKPDARDPLAPNLDIANFPLTVKRQLLPITAYHILQEVVAHCLALASIEIDGS